MKSNEGLKGETEENKLRKKKGEVPKIKKKNEKKKKKERKKERKKKRKKDQESQEFRHIRDTQRPMFDNHIVLVFWLDIFGGRWWEVGEVLIGKG